MKKYIIGIIASILILSCKPAEPRTVEDKPDSISVVVDSVKVTDPTTKPDSIVVPSESVYKPLLAIKEIDYDVSKNANDSLLTVNKKLNFELDQHLKNQADARAYVNKAMANKANDKFLKGWMISTINKPVIKFKGSVIGEPLKVDSTLLVKDKYNLYNKEVKRLDSINIILIDKNKADARQLLHKKFVTTNAQFYLNITIKNPSQDKFLKGWMRRALSQ